MTEKFVFVDIKYRVIGVIIGIIIASIIIFYSKPNFLYDKTDKNGKKY